MNLKNNAKWKKPDTKKDYMLYDSSYMKCPERANFNDTKQISDGVGVKVTAETACKQA